MTLIIQSLGVSFKMKIIRIEWWLCNFEAAQRYFLIDKIILCISYEYDSLIVK